MMTFGMSEILKTLTNAGQINLDGPKRAMGH